MYNIKQAAARAGVSVPVLRAWERRYGIVSPARTASGYRQFDDEAVDRIRAMRGLITEGWSPSAAAAAILSGSIPHADAGDSGPGTPPAIGDRGRAAADDALGRANAANEGAIEAAQLADRFVDAAASLEPNRVDDVLDDLFSRGSFERIATDLLFPALERLGDAWAAGAVSVAGEHLASHAVQRRLGLALDAAGRLAGRGGDVVVGLPPGGRHELGALAFAVAARRAGLAVTYLGPDLPVEDWLVAADGASAAVIGVVTARDRRPSLEVARRLSSAFPDLVVALGGRAAPSTARVDGETALRLPERLAESVAVLAAAIGQREQPRS